MIRLGMIPMPCYHPIEGWRGLDGKVTFQARGAVMNHRATVPCGKCIGCRLERSRQWAMRCMHEAQLHEENSFITLTYSDKHLPMNASLDRDAFPLFMKRLRKSYGERKLRYFHAGEYGSKLGRPHYHACIFGADFSDDRVYWRRTEQGHKIFRSERLERAWPLGQAEIGSMTFESAAYVARYCCKQDDRESEYYRCDDDGLVYDIEPEYATMSRRPGIGAEWIDKYGDETYRSDSVVVRGKEMRPPKYYDVRHQDRDSLAVESAKLHRAERRRREDERPERLVAREACARAKLILKERGL